MRQRAGLLLIRFLSLQAAIPGLSTSRQPVHRRLAGVSLAIPTAVPTGGFTPSQQALPQIARGAIPRRLPATVADPATGPHPTEDAQRFFIPGCRW